eukprot:scaffold13438_cov66-Skeletonema_dohrnii-CCMP3373.AAC.3
MRLIGRSWMEAMTVDEASCLVRRGLDGAFSTKRPMLSWTQERSAFERQFCKCTRGKWESSASESMQRARAVQV